MDITTPDELPCVDVVVVEPMQGYHLLLTFDDGVRGVFDMTPYLERPAWSELRDPTLFRAAYVENGTVCWPGGMDFAPDRLYTDCLRVERRTGVSMAA